MKKKSSVTHIDSQRINVSKAHEIVTISNLDVEHLSCGMNFNLTYQASCQGLAALMLACWWFCKSLVMYGQESRALYLDLSVLAGSMILAVGYLWENKLIMDRPFKYHVIALIGLFSGLASSVGTILTLTGESLLMAGYVLYL